MSQTDRELTELAAKAAGEVVEWLDGQKVFYRKAYEWPREKGFFAPLHDDGEALRLAVKLHLELTVFRDHVTAFHATSWCDELNAGDPEAATRRAIVRAAAEIGRAMP